MNRLTDNGDGTVTDTVTGLVWTKSTVAKDIEHDDVGKAIAALGGDWRLPTVDELITLLDRARYNPAIDTDAFPDTESDWYWTSTPCAENPSAVWVVCFEKGHVCCGNTLTLEGCIRAVSSNSVDTTAAATARLREGGGE